MRYGVFILIIVFSTCTLNAPRKAEILTPEALSDTGSLEVSITPSKKVQESRSFKTQAIEPAKISAGHITVTGIGIASAIEPTSPVNPVPLTIGNNINPVQFGVIPTGKNRIITVAGQGFGGSTLPSQYTIKGVVNIEAGPNTANVSPQTTPTAQVIEALIALGATEASNLDYTALQTVIDRLVDNDTADPTDDLHPSLIKADAIANFINTNHALPPATPPNLDDYAQTPGVLIANLSGLQEYYKFNTTNKTVFPPIEISVNDSSSEVLKLPAENKDGQIGSKIATMVIKPGSGYQVSVKSPYHKEKTATFNISEGGIANLNFSFSTADKHHYFQTAIANNSQEVRRYKANETLDVLIIKPSNPSSSAIGWNATEHLPNVYGALEQINTLIPEITIGTITEVFDNDPDFALRPMPGGSAPFNANPGDTSSPNHPNNQGPAPAGHLVGRYDLYIQWKTNFCGENSSALGFCRNSYTSNPNSYITRIQLATQQCTGGIHIPPETALSVATHEIIHGLGINNHSSDPQDIMYFQTSLTHLLQTSPSLADINTVRFLHDADASRQSTPHTP